MYVSPTVDQEFKDTRERIVTATKERGESVILCGDGRMDSPGFSATKGAYTLMNYETKELVTMEFGDKREVSLQNLRSFGNL